MNSSSPSKPLELDAVMRSIRPHVRTPETPAPASAASDRAQAAEAAAASRLAPPIEPQQGRGDEPAPRALPERPATAAPTPAAAPASRKPRRAERTEHRVTVDLIPASGEATVGVYLRLPKSVHQQLKTVVFQNELTEQGHQSIADITREAIADWLARHYAQSQAA